MVQHTLAPKPRQGEPFQKVNEREAISVARYSKKVPKFIS